MEPDSPETVNPNAFAPTDLADVVQRAGATFGDEPAKALASVNAALTAAEGFRDEATYATARALLGAMKNFHTAVLLSNQGDFANAVELISQATRQFADLDAREFADASHGVELYFRGTLELQRQNFSSAIELLEEAPQSLRRAGEFGSRFRPLIDHLVPDSLVAAGVIALTKHDFARGRVLLEDGAKKYESVATLYHDEQSPAWFFFKGMAKLYRAYFASVERHWQFFRFDFPGIERADDASVDAREARELLSKSDLQYHVRQQSYRMAGVVLGILEVLPAAAAIANKLITTQAPTGTDYTALRAQLKAAEKEAVAAGEQGLSFLLICQHVEGTLNGLQRYDEARPAVASPAITPKGPVRLFVMMPFAEEAAVVETALLQVFEGDPYWFDVILARDRTLRSGLFENVKAHMALVDGFVADVTGHNPNVMLELGMTENDPRGRPVLILRREGSAEPISDLRGRLYIEYAVPAGDRADQVASIVRQLRQKLGSIEDIEHLLARRERRYLSQQYIAQKRVRLEPGEIERLQRAFPAVEDLEAADADTVSRKTGFDEPLSAQIVQAFRPGKRAASRSRPGSKG